MLKLITNTGIKKEIINRKKNMKMHTKTGKMNVKIPAKRKMFRTIFTGISRAKYV